MGAWKTKFALLLLVITSSKASWIDPDTPKEHHTTKALVQTDAREYALVFSDEFNVDGRTFNDGNDPRWTALNKNDYTNDALHYYSHDNVITTNGVLNITTERKENKYKAFNEKTKKFFVDSKYIQSGMVQGWNKFCITGGIVEFSAKLPGDPGIGGLWPALWLLGNLARASYVGSSDFVWPFSYNKCNQAIRTSQEINACSRVGHFGLAKGQGRGAPEIDVLETMQGTSEVLPNTPITRPYLSCSYQVSPGISENRPILGQQPTSKNRWYSHLEYGNTTNSSLNPFFYGVTLVHEPSSYTYQSDALSANTKLGISHYENQHLYRVEWEPPEPDGSGGYIKWFIDGDLTYGVYGESLEITGSEIPSEPMYLLMNTAVSSNWGFPKPCPDGCNCKCYECGKPECACALPQGYCNNFPAHFEIDYVRVYQAVNESKHVLGCSTKERPTDLFIKGHARRYMAEGDTMPLLPLRRGGAICSDNNDCGGDIHGGMCNEKKRCACNDGFTGPTCLAYAGFYDNEDVEVIPPFHFAEMYVPRGLIVIVAILLVGFLLSLAGFMRSSKKAAAYQKIPNSYDASLDTTARGGTHTVAATSYQNSGITQKFVTYFVIDGRLVDQT